MAATASPVPAVAATPADRFNAEFKSLIAMVGTLCPSDASLAAFVDSFDTLVGAQPDIVMKTFVREVTPYIGHVMQDDVKFIDHMMSISRIPFVGTLEIGKKWATLDHEIKVAILHDVEKCWEIGRVPRFGGGGVPGLVGAAAAGIDINALIANPEIQACMADVAAGNPPDVSKILSSLGPMADGVDPAQAQAALDMFMP